MWITEIRLKNYRAFAEEVVVRIPEGSHLLVYGENGSGKSSLFRGVKEFFATAEDERSAEFMRNRWQEDEDDEVLGQIGIRLKENVFFQWLSDPMMRYHDIPFIEEASRLSGFLSYKDFIPHFQRPQAENDDFLFRLLTEELLAPATVIDFRTMGTEIKFGTLVAEYVKDLTDLYPAHVKVIEEQQAAALADYPEPVHEELEYPDPPFPEEKLEYPDPVFSEPMDEEPDLPDPIDEEPGYFPEPMDEEPGYYPDPFDPEPDPHEPITTPWSNHADLLSNLNDIYYGLVTDVNKLSNQFIQTYFDPKLRMAIQPGKFTLEEVPETDRLEYQFNPGRANFVLYYAGKKLVDYHDFLNEARLSAFTLCFRLAAIKLLPVADGDSRVLFLDDIFTGLDMNNRLPLLRLIKEEFMGAEVAPFQVGIATHDRRWYELAKGWFEQRDVKIKAIEMYAGRSDDLQQPDEVVIIQEGLSYIEKARAYFKAKDYPSTANLLRKASEEKMRELLPKHKRLKIDDKTGLQKSETSLEILEKRLVRYLEDNDFDMSRLAPFGTFKKVVLNPLSHDDLEAPHYRSELEEAFKVVDYLLSIEVREVDFPQGKHIGEISMDFSYPDPENKKRRIKHSIIPREELRFVTVPDQGTKLMSCECRYRHDHEAEVVCADINSAIDLLWAKGGYDLPVDYKQAYNNLKISSRKTLADLLEQATDSPR